MARTLRTTLTTLAAAAFALGCNQTNLPGPEQAADSGSPAAPAASAPAAKATPLDNTALDPVLHQSFEQATRKEPPEGWHPLERTLSGKSVGPLYEAVRARWDGIRFASDRGKPLQYAATLETDHGPVEVALLHHRAPNHVRNFIALAQSGYYDGLIFERTLHEKSEGQPDLELIEAGCPLGTGELGQGSIGYWLKPEFNDEPHAEGTVGACHDEEPDTACTKFYLTLNKAPYLDKNFTVFGKVTSGLDVARKIFSMPVRNDADGGDRPEKPVTLRKVTVRASEVEK